MQLTRMQRRDDWQHPSSFSQVVPLREQNCTLSILPEY
jgi:hypothetical protein